MLPYVHIVGYVWNAHPPARYIARLRFVVMAIAHKAMNLKPTTQFLMRLPKMHQKLLDTMVD